MARSNIANGIRSEKGAVHILGPLLVVASIYSTYLMFKQEARAESLSRYVQYQKNQMDSLELRMQILELRHGKVELK